MHFPERPWILCPHGPPQRPSPAHFLIISQKSVLSCHQNQNQKSSSGKFRGLWAAQMSSSFLLSARIHFLSELDTAAFPGIHLPSFLCREKGEFTNPVFLEWEISHWHKCFDTSSLEYNYQIPSVVPRVCWTSDQIFNSGQVLTFSRVTSFPWAHTDFALIYRRETAQCSVLGRSPLTAHCVVKWHFGPELVGW